MARRTIEVPLIPRLIKRVEEILIESGLTRRSVIKGDTIEAYGEAGIKKFYIIQDSVTDDDRANLIIDVGTKQALDIITNLVKTEVEELYAELKEMKTIEKSKASSIGKESKIESKGKCLACEGALKDLGIKKIAEDLRANVVVCQECGRLEFYKE